MRGFEIGHVGHVLGSLRATPPPPFSLLYKEKEFPQKRDDDELRKLRSLSFR